ncbi:MAG TPA: PilZ domain-containing protein [Candidatus Acidoferrales bacterium]|nr:PilZ domain-containing protein [Candidatus Acidoferrales bacterium]
MTEQMAATEADIQKRRSTRIAQSVPVTVIGVDALGQSFKERTSTVSVNCHGCKYQSKHYVPKGSQVTIEIPRPQSEAPARTVEATVAWVQRPRTVRELFQIGVQFTVPGNAWGIAFPPADWFPLPDEQEGEIQIPVPPPAAETLANQPLMHHEMPAEIPAPVIALESDVEAAGEQAEDNVRVLPVAAQAQETMSAARQMARLVAEAKQHLRRSMQSGAAEAVAQELRTAREQVEVQLRTVVNEAVEDSVTKATENSVQRSVQSAVENAVRDSLEHLVGQATQQVVQNALAAFEQARRAASPKPEELDTQVRAAVERVVETSAAKLAEQTIQQSVQQTVEQAVKQSVQQAVERATANLPMAQRVATVTAPTEEVLRLLDEAAQARLSNWRKELEDAAGKLREQSRDNLSAESEAATRKWREQFDVALTGASAQMTEQLNQISHAATTRAEQEISARSASLQGLLNEAASEAQKNLEALCSGLEQERTRAEAVIDKADAAVRRAEETGARMESMSRAAYDEAQRHLDGLLASQTAELNRRVDDVIQKKAGELEKPINEVADGALKRLAEQAERQLAPHYERARQIARSSQEAEQKLQRLGQQVEEQLAPHIERAQQTGQELRAANQHAEDALHQFRAQMHEVSEQALTASLERMRQQSAELPAEFEQTCRAALARVEEELDAKSTDTTHATFEALYKASEWYQKKAQTSMQAMLEKMMDQSTGAMRERAAEVSRMFGSELDHYSRSYVEHAQGMIEEDAKEIKQRTREQLEETAKTVAASATDELRRITSESLARFEEAAKVSAEQTHAGMKEGADKALGEFDTHLEERMVQGATLARKHLEEQLKPLVEAFYARREAEQAAWLEQMKGSVEKSIEQYKERLENTSNSWLLASATTLGQHSKSVLQTLSEAAEERLRDTCADVFAGLGDTLRSRLLGLSSEVGTGKKPPEKK